ncbi:multidrug transporter [Phytopseudomonas dryadis]|uniref:Multidrug transporter n=1 Tax=Phytopseudomonas dryadis TaxID=2487520 RepID=A0A4Q9R8Y0_9GAMM|nr:MULTISPECIES: multidrug transporter [Pseudomonas]TBU96390.1 multidrug transporter [Pseudomonas dryadis]TBV03554.1 multidrug transporter [Pseudomonas dryadis]TBV16606.1 multidrug transporter [Pseudomonas sp. FRB 230]
MIFGAILVLSWLILLIRYPSKALPISLAALIGLGLVASWVLWQESRENRHLSRLELRLQYAPGSCPADRPLNLHLHNGSDVPMLELRWRIAAYRPGDSVNLAERLYETPRYSGPGELLPGADWQACLPLPTLRSGYRPGTLEFRAEQLQGTFAR